MLRVRITNIWIGEWRNSLDQAFEVFIDTGESRLHHPGDGALVGANRSDVPRHQDGHHGINGSGGKVEGLAGSVRVRLREAIPQSGLILSGRHYPPRRDSLQAACNLLLANPFL